MLSFSEKNNDLCATFEKCIQSREPFADDDEKETCRKMVEQLPQDLVVTAANTSYAYWYLSLEQQTCPSEDDKIRMAMREARRHLTYMSGDYNKAMQNFQESLEYRKENKLELLRTCFATDSPHVQPGDEAKSKEMAELVRSDIRKQYVVMRGHDRQYRSVMIKFPRTQRGTVQESYIMGQIYTAERSIASTEFYSLGAEERSLAIYDFYGSDSSNAPPFQTQAAAATLLQKLYPERLEVLVMVEPPFWLRGALNLLRPFLSSTITQRIKWASGVEAKEEVFSPLLDPEQATPHLLKEGKLDSPFSLGHFLEDVPFYSLYDDVKCERPIEKEEYAVQEPIEPETESTAPSLWTTIASASIF